MKKIVLSIACFCCIQISVAQVPNHHWTHASDGGALAKGYCIASDANGNVYTAGIFGSTSDFDPSAGVSNLTSHGSDDIYIVKTTPDGTFVWARNLGGSSADIPNELVIDLSGNIYLTGIFAGTADFDPEAGVSNLVSTGGDDVFATKLTANGQLVWAKSFGGSGDDIGYAIEIDDYDSTVFIIGNYTGTADLNPGAATATVTSNGSSDIFMVKLSNTGDYITSKTIGGTGMDRGRDLVIDVATGDQFLTGSFGNTVDFDPGAGVVELIGGSQDIFVLKLDVSNNFTWAKRMGGIAVDEGRNIDFDANGFIYVNGSFISTCNFDPNGGTTNVTSNGSDDVFVVQLTPAGALSWVKTFGSIGTEDFMDMDVTSFGDIYVTGEMADDMDANPDAVITFDLTKVGAEDAYIVSLASDGNFNWATSYGANSVSAYTRGFGVFADEQFNVYTTGSFQNSVDFNPGAAVNTLNAVAGSDSWYQKLGPGFNGLEEALENGGFQISPNPSSGKSILSTENPMNNAEITVTDASGKQVLITKGVSGMLFEIDFSPLEKGIYFLEIVQNNTHEQVKFVKE